MGTSLGDFNSESVYENVHSLLANEKNKDIPLEIRRSYPWILWYLWKNRNSICFEGKRFLATDTVDKMMEEVSGRFLAQSHQLQTQETQSISEVREHKKWKQSPDLWLKCNIGISSAKDKAVAGGSWLLRDSRGVVLLHNRRAFSHVLSMQDA